MVVSGVPTLHSAPPARPGHLCACCPPSWHAHCNSLGLLSLLHCAFTALVLKAHCALRMAFLACHQQEGSVAEATALQLKQPWGAGMKGVLLCTSAFYFDSVAVLQPFCITLNLAHWQGPYGEYTWALAADPATFHAQLQPGFVFCNHRNTYISISWEPEAKRDIYFQLVPLSWSAHTQRWEIART